MPLRDYQQQLINDARQELQRSRSVCIQLPTGGGKTPIVAEIFSIAAGRGYTCWFVVPRNELMFQASRHFSKWKIPHGLIAAGSQESSAYHVHIVSKDTLLRRYARIKRWPDLLIFDEAHLYLDRQNEIISQLRIESQIIGLTATPERLDGRGLASAAGGPYDSIIFGPSIPWLTEHNFLSPLRYFSPPIDGLNNLHRHGTDYDAIELEELFKRKKIYGELVGHYEKYGNGKPALIFCRDVKQAYQTADRFQEKGFSFFCIEGSMSSKRRRELIKAHSDGRIHGLTNCEIATYGLDIPRVEYAASIRPTLSRALYFQMVGRILRPFQELDGQGNVTYRKEEALFFDHVDLLSEHQEPGYPGIPPHFVPEITWNFFGKEKRKCGNVNIDRMQLCPLLDYMYCHNPHCSSCVHNPDKSINDVRRPPVVVDTELVETARPKKESNLNDEERREYVDRINAAISEFTNGVGEGCKIIPGPVGTLLQIAEELNHPPLWVYHKLNCRNRFSVNVSLLHEIARQMHYKPGWAYFQAQRLASERKVS